MTNLLDGNVLVAMALTDHTHHEVASEWRAKHKTEGFATCPITQGTLLRLLMIDGATVKQARQVLSSICALPHHEFWPDDVEYLDVPLKGVIGHRQITDGYLAQLARARSGRLVTFDRGLAALHPDVTSLVPTRRSLD